MDKPKHNPSAKHTLDEVLKSLQDLVRNELADDTDAGTKPRRKPKREPTSPRAAPTPADSAPGHAANDDAELYDLHADGVASDNEIVTDAAGVGDTGVNVDTAVLPDAYQDPAPAALQTTFPLPNGAPITTRQPKPKKKKPAPPEQTSLLWEDVPVLNEVVVLPADAAPPPERAREIAVRVIAKLNIELRKAGNATLDPVIIDRLEQLLREALLAAATEPRKP